jgi:hypothetical protein
VPACASITSEVLGAGLAGGGLRDGNHLLLGILVVSLGSVVAMTRRTYRVLLKLTRPPSLAARRATVAIGTHILAIFPVAPTIVGTDAEAVASSMVADTANAGREVRVQQGAPYRCGPCTAGISLALSLPRGQ